MVSDRLKQLYEEMKLANEVGDDLMGPRIDNEIEKLEKEEGVYDYE